MVSRCRRAFVLVALLLPVFLGGASAQQRDAMPACLGLGSVTVEKRVDACLSIIESGTATKENLALAFGNRGVARAQRKDLEGARQDYQESMRLDSSSGASHRFRGNLYLLDGDERKAGEEFHHSIRIDPKHGPAYVNLGVLAGRRGLAASALEYLNKAIEVDPESLRAYMFRGGARIQLEAYDQAIEDFAIALKNPDFVEAFFGRGTAFAHKGEHQKALDDYDEGLRLKNDQAEPFSTRCVFRAVLGQAFDEAMVDCDRALSLSMMASPAVRNMRGFALLKFEKHERALKEFDAAVKLMPRLPPGRAESLAIALYGRGLAKLRLGDGDSAKDFELSTNAYPKARQRAAVFFAIKE